MKKLFPKLASGRNPNWAWMDRFDAPDYDDPSQTYLSRLRIIQTPLGGIYVHRFYGPDPRQTLHDHPFGFFSILLRGGYVERRLDPVTMQVDESRLVLLWNRIRAGEAHAITKVFPGTMTLVFAGPRTRTWGYWEPVEDLLSEEVLLWQWTEFSKHGHNQEFVDALAKRKELLAS